MFFSHISLHTRTELEESTSLPSASRTTRLTITVPSDESSSVLPASTSKATSSPFENVVRGETRST